MNELKVFENPQFGSIRTVMKGNEPWFVAADVCRVLGHSNSRMALERLDEDEKGVSSIYTPGGEQEMSIVNEPGLYSLVLGSRKPEARSFKRWITHEVIPAIRKHGLYATADTVERMLADPDVAIQLLQQIKQEREQRRLLESRMEQDKPKVLFAESVECSSSEILVGELAKILKQNGMNIGQNRLYERLRKDGYLINRQGSDYNMPTQRSMEMGLFRIKESCFTHPDGHISVTKTTKVTGKGQIYFVNKYKTA